MRKNLIILFLLHSFVLCSQVIQIDPKGNPASNYSPTDLIKKVLTNSGCADISNFTYKSGDVMGIKSYGYFNRGNSKFPLKEGVILSTGRAIDAVGPNDKKGSSGESSIWTGDSDIKKILDKNLKKVSKTFNATVIEFDFVPIGNKISFDYLFASEEYDDIYVCVGEGNLYQDGFAFLISGPGIENDEGVSGKNIALISKTDVPVSAGTINGGDTKGNCKAVNQELYHSYNNNKVEGIKGYVSAEKSPVDFMGRTVVLTAESVVIPNKKYHIKLVIADRADTGFNSAVFLAAGSFNLGVNLGEDRTIKSNNPLCVSETLKLDAGNYKGVTTYKWYEKSQPSKILGVESTLLVNKSGVYKVEVTSGKGCTSEDEIRVESGALPKVQKKITLKQCDDDTDGFSVFNLTKIEPLLTGEAKSLTITYHKTIEDANGDKNPVVNYESFSNKSQNKIYARVENEFGCYDTSEITLLVSTTNIPDSLKLVYTKCDDKLEDNDDNNGVAAFNLVNIKDDIKSVFPANQNLQVTFYKTKQDAIEEKNSIKTSSYRNTGSPFLQKIFVRVENNDNKSCLGVKAVTLKVNLVPQFDLVEKVFICLNKEPIEVKAENTVNIEKYQWYDSKGNALPDGNKSFYKFKTLGTYKLEATTSKGCNKIKEVLVEASNIATVNEIKVINKGEEGNTIKISVTGEGPYEFSLEDKDEAYQDSNIIKNVPPGNYTLYIRDKKGCGTISRKVDVLGFPRFFTPNEDGFNDTWNVVGASPNQLNSKVFVYNRYGKLLKQFKAKDIGWDGTYNGELLPSSDYWFSIEFEDGTIQNGHFSLIRK